MAKLTEIASGKYSERKKLIKESHTKVMGIVYPEANGPIGGKHPKFRSWSGREKEASDKNSEYVQELVKDKDTYSKKITNEETKKEIKKYLVKTIKEAQSTIKDAKKALKQIKQI